MISELARLTRTPEQRQVGEYFKTTFGLAWDAGYGKNKKPCFIDCVAWGKIGETILQYCDKGKEVFITGRLEFEQWEKDGNKRSKHILNVTDMRFTSQPKEKKEQRIDQDGGDLEEPFDNENIPF